jgi:hypothetical protein
LRLTVKGDACLKPFSSLHAFPEEREKDGSQKTSPDRDPYIIPPASTQNNLFTHAQMGSSPSVGLSFHARYFIASFFFFSSFTLSFFLLVVIESRPIYHVSLTIS